MSEMLNHYGIKGMKWGVRRTPEQLGHATVRKQNGGEDKRAKLPAKKTPGKSARSSTALSDDELQKRINRLNLEERYDDLIARQKARNKSGVGAWAKEAAIKELKRGGEQLLGAAVSKFITKITNKINGNSNQFDIFDYIDEDVRNMDSETIAKVAKWYDDFIKIETARSKFKTGDGSKTKETKDKKESEDSDTSSSGKSKTETTSSSNTHRPPSGDNRSSSGKTSRKQMDEWIRQRNRAMRDLKR